MAHNRHNLTWGFCHGRECGYLRNQLCLGWCEQCWHEWVDEGGIDPLVRAARFYPPELQLSTLQQLWLQQRRILRRLRGEDLFCYSSPPPPGVLPWRSDPVASCSHGDPIQFIIIILWGSHGDPIHSLLAPAQTLRARTRSQPKK